MMRKVSSIALDVIAGFFFYTVMLIGFVNTPSLGAKWGVMIGFVVPAVLALCCGLALNRFRNWKRDTGVVLLCSSGFTAFLVFSLACMLVSDEAFRKMMKPDTLGLFSDYFTGGAVIIGFAGFGWFLFKRN